MCITKQGTKDLRQFYDLSHGWAGHWQKPITAMLELVAYLEDTVDFPPQWVFTSHEDLVFAGQDDYRQSIVSVHPLSGTTHGGPTSARFKIRYPAQAPWSHITGYADDVEQAWHMIESVLLKATRQMK